MYDYKFIKVPLGINGGFKTKTGDAFERCKEIILEEAKKGWRLKQVVVPANEKTGVYGTYCYQIIFEKEAKEV